MNEIEDKYPPLPEPRFSRVVDGLPCISIMEHEYLMRAYVDADRTIRAQALPAAVAVPDVEFSRFLTDVMTAAGLVEHGKKCKALGERIAEMVMRLRLAHQPAPVAQGDAEVLSMSQALFMQRDADARDAARYRWLRINAIGAFRTNDGKGPVSVYHLAKIPALQGIPEETDAAIDAARAQAKEGQSHE